LLAYLTLVSMPLVAGGDAERVSIQALTIDGVDYTLIVTPAPSKSIVPDVYVGLCKRFEVRGTYRWLKGTIFRQEATLSREGHLQALEYLRRAFAAKQAVNLGWIGRGFVPVDPDDPCIVKSRALQLVTDERGTYVLSYYVSTSARSD
jgi:hypothetical protein